MNFFSIGQISFFSLLKIKSVLFLNSRLLQLSDSINNALLEIRSAYMFFICKSMIIQAAALPTTLSAIEADEKSNPSK